jgi:hypothetical protein
MIDLGKIITFDLIWAEAIWAALGVMEACLTIRTTSTECSIGHVQRNADELEHCVHLSGGALQVALAVFKMDGKQRRNSNMTSLEVVGGGY